MKTHKANGDPRTCKFCHEHVGWDDSTGRVVNLDGTMHSDTCPKRKAFYKSEAASGARKRRDAR